MTATITPIICLSIGLIAFLSLLVSLLSRTWFPVQYVYMNTIAKLWGDEEYLWYDDAKNH